MKTSKSPSEQDDFDGTFNLLCIPGSAEDLVGVGEGFG